ncbi:hypothetical protein GGR28_002229 [Lewinella aquimaris]|uniref:DUF3078 domain-containing protein n=1 Tax=Neolewinella aquimaris TaxID=1835722 RepID=A0A840E214_9BACT|nr:DUF3078 domain-containing protein [Neolewinella aquimaris]MBB4079604.1 hypothetical protein [Neolewinella aquimaris]
MSKASLFLLFLFVTAGLMAQKKEAEEIPEGWNRGAGVGFDFAQLLQINPKQGAGQNRLGLGGAFDGFANYKMGRQAWDNTVLWQFAVQRLGAGVIAQGATSKIPFQKTIDEFRLGSKYGFQIKPDGKLYYSVNGTFLSQLTSTYQFPDLYSGNFVSDFIDSGRSPLSKFLSPATVTLSLGIDYKPNDQLSIFYSPLGSKFIIVASDSIASRGVHGNEVSGEPTKGIYPEFQNLDAQIGSLAQIKYKVTFGGEDRFGFSSNLGLYSNYLDNPQNVDVDWQNTLSFAFTENLHLNVFLNVFYDDDIRVQITDYNAPNGVAGLGKRVSITEQLVIAYARSF